MEGRPGEMGFWFLEVKIVQIGSFFPYWCGCRCSFCTFSTANQPVKNVFSLCMCSFQFTVIVCISSKKNLKQDLSKGD